MEVRKAKRYLGSNTDLNGWEEIKLGSCFDFKNGLNKEKKYFGQGTPIVNYMDVYKNRGLRVSDIIGKVLLSKAEIKNYEVQKGDVLFTRTSETVEEIGISTVILEDVIDTVFSGFVLRARPKNDKLTLSFKKYCFSTTEVRKEITSKSSYTTRALTNGRLLSNVKLKIPKSEEEQIAIAQVLSNTDELISSLEKLIEKKKLIKQGTMQQLLTGKKRLPGFGGKWVKMKLGDIGSCLRGVSYKPELDLFPYDTKDSVRLLRAHNVYESRFVKRDLQFVHCRKVKEIQKLISFDIIICMASGSKELVGKSALFLNSDDLEYTFGAFMGCFRTNTQIAKPSFVFYFFQSNKFRDYIDVLLSGSSINNLRPADIESIENNFPLLDEQIAISNIVNDMDSEIEELEQKLNKYKSIKQGMMQNLLTGKIRLNH